MSQTASQEAQTSNLSKRRKNWTCAKKPAKLNILIVDRKSTRLNSSHANISYAVFCLKKKKKKKKQKKKKKKRTKQKKTKKKTTKTKKHTTISRKPNRTATKRR